MSMENVQEVIHAKWVLYLELPHWSDYQDLQFKLANSHNYKIVVMVVINYIFIVAYMHQ